MVNNKKNTGKAKTLIKVIVITLLVILFFISVATDSMLWVDIGVILAAIALCIFGIMDLKADRDRKGSIFIIIAGSVCALTIFVRLIV
ncbi:protein-S-isoprenylcysteine O-methyltransferase Ste14 [Desmospora profundinema]|uniref:Protein-S-isoprenylcysteine O-methyltransferase Ste14 n=1 Tax=Desmospora profundinema TaxID=1571184 RepID=A0ABU1INE3_9BACL|nr:protein-S-isoprenylcysteine O-methyltransferase Ste14 [Desmospora profundinema]